VDGGIDDPLDVCAEPTMAFVRTAYVVNKTRCLSGGGVTGDESSYCAGRKPKTLRGGFNARRHRSITREGLANDGLTLLSFFPGYLLNAADVLGALIELQWRQTSDAAELGQRNLSKFVGAGL
jgi:hypothetical protein